MLTRDRRLLAPFPPCSLSGSLPDSAVRAWADVGSWYAPEVSTSTAPATVSSVLTEASQREIDEVEETILGIEQAIKDSGGLDDAEDSALEGLAGIDLYDEDSCDEISPGRYSRMESERTVEARPVLETAKRVKEIIRLEASNASKASSSSEQAAKKDEEASLDFRQSLLFLRHTLPEAAVPQLTPVWPRAAAM